MRKPTASLSLDLDNQWSYMKTHGDPGWEKFPTYLDRVVPHFNQVLDSQHLRMTVFVVGQDAALDENAEALQQIPEAGHEVGNHSFHHEPWLHLYTQDQIEEEVCRAETAIRKVTGERTRGWRGPGFSFSKTLLNVLAQNDYQYDCSTFPTYMGPLARRYYFWKSDLPEEEKKQRSQLFGKFSEGFRPLNPYRWQTEHGDLLEIPVTTLPGLKVPLHASYILYLSSFSKLAAKTYFSNAIWLCRVAGVEPSLLLHPLDFISGDSVPELKFFPAMGMKTDEKLDFMQWLLSTYKESFDVVPMGVHARRLNAKESLPARELPDMPGELVTP